MKIEKYKIEIELGNETMLEPWQVAQALYALADALATSGEFTTRNIRDYNGNTVGYGAKSVEEYA